MVVTRHSSNFTYMPRLLDSPTEKIFLESLSVVLIIARNMSRPALSQILLHVSPPPLNITETRDVYRAMKRYGEVEVFKVVRVSGSFLSCY